MEPGKGSVFRVVICGEDSEKLASNTLLKENGGSTEAIINPHTSEGSGQAVLPLSGGARERLLLLVVEDDQDIREFIASVFTGLFDVRQAKDGEEGWKVAQETTPDIIISDIMMPRMDGNELCRKIKNDVRTSHIPVIATTPGQTRISPSLSRSDCSARASTICSDNGNSSTTPSPILSQTSA